MNHLSVIPYMEHLPSIHACITRFKFWGDSSHDRNRGPDQDYEIMQLCIVKL